MELARTILPCATSNLAEFRHILKKEEHVNIHAHSNININGDAYLIHCRSPTVASTTIKCKTTDKQKQTQKPNAVIDTYEGVASYLQACTHIFRFGFHGNIFLLSKLINLYTKSTA